MTKGVRGFNFQFGCSNGCKYCHARKISKRFNLIENDEDFHNFCLIKGPSKYSSKLLNRKNDGVIIFSTTHDIDYSPSAMKRAEEYLVNLLKHGNKVLWVSKADIRVFKILIPAVWSFYKNLEIRISIGSANNDVLNYWEPNAPSLESRLEALKLAYNEGFKTSVSVDPMLDDGFSDLVNLVAPICKGSVWFDFMNTLDFKNNIKAKVPTPKNKEVINKLIDLKSRYQDRIMFKNSVIKAIRENVK